MVRLVPHLVVGEALALATGEPVGVVARAVLRLLSSVRQSNTAVSRPCSLRPPRLSE